MKKYKKKIIKSVLLILIMTACFICFDLYIPIESMILGKEPSNTEFWSYIKLDYGDWVIIGMFGMFGFIDKKTIKPK